MANSISRTELNIVQKNRESQTIGLLVVVTLLCLLPFIGKAVHIDDPLFIWTAKHIQGHPFDPYNFTVNWDGVSRPMYDVTKNPPLASYYMSVATLLFGWSEPALHTMFFIPTIILVIGIYILAKNFCSRPMEAALAALLTPAVLISSTTLMCDVLMLCFWVWSALLWIRGVRDTHRKSLLIASFLIAGCALTKYFGMALIPLLVVWTVAERKRFDMFLLLLFIPIIILVAYQWSTAALYGRGLLTDAAAYASTEGMLSGSEYVSKLLIGLAFTGGCVATVIFYVSRLWNHSILLGGGIASIIITGGVLFTLQSIGGVILVDGQGVQWGVLLQLTVLIIAGVVLLALSIQDVMKHRNAASLFLLLWIVGTLIFAVVINWTINGRSLLPLVPAMGILIMRRLDDRNGRAEEGMFWKRFLPLLPSAVVALLVTHGDYRLANSVRDDVTTIWSHPRSEHSTIWFQGHWGFQYYMETHGGKSLDVEHSTLVQGDILIVPLNNTSLFHMPNQFVPLRDSVESKTLSPLTCMNRSAGAGFYSDVWGPLPFAFGEISPEKYYVHVVKEEITFQRP